MYTTVNILGTLNVIRAATTHGVGRVLFAGSSSVYNDNDVPFTEDSYPLRPRSVYGASKAAAEMYLRTWHDLYGLPVTILRFFSVYGPWGRPDMAPHIFTQRILDGQPITVTSDDRQRDFTYIDDVIAGTQAALKHAADFDIINIGRGTPTKITDLIATIERATGKKAQQTSRPAPPGEMRITYADTSKAKRLFGYESRVSLDEGVGKLVAWFTEWRATSVPK